MFRSHPQHPLFTVGTGCGASPLTFLNSGMLGMLTQQFLVLAVVYWCACVHPIYCRGGRCQHALSAHIHWHSVLCSTFYTTSSLLLRSLGPTHPTHLDAVPPYYPMHWVACAVDACNKCVSSQALLCFQSLSTPSNALCCTTSAKLHVYCHVHAPNHWVTTQYECYKNGSKDH